MNLFRLQNQPIMHTPKPYGFFSLLFLLFLSGCATGPSYYSGKRTPAPKTATSKPYRITNSHMKNKLFHPKQHYEHYEEGYASYYGGRDVFHGRKTSTGEIFDKNKLMAAHRTLPLPSVVRVTNIDTKSKGYGRSIKVRVVDRGPFAHIDKRIIDVSEKSAKLLGFYKSGTAKVRLETLVGESIRLAQGKGYRHDKRVMLAKGTKRKRNIMLAMKPTKKIQIASLSAVNLKFLTKGTPTPKVSPFAHQSAAKSVSPPRDILMAQAEDVADRVITPGQKPTSISDLFEMSSYKKPITSSAPRPTLKPSTPKPKIKELPTSRPAEVFMSADTDTGIFVQAGSYSKLKNARIIKSSLQEALNTENVRVSALKVQENTHYRVRLGPFDTSEQAEYLLAQLEQHGHDDAYIVYE